MAKRRGLAGERSSDYCGRCCKIKTLKTLGDAQSEGRRISKGGEAVKGNNLIGRVDSVVVVADRTKVGGREGRAERE